MAEAVHSTPASVIPFPSRDGQNDQTFAPDSLRRAVDDWSRARNTALAAQIFGSTPHEAVDLVRATILEGGADAVATMLEELKLSIGIMRGAVAELVAADHLISTAADRVLTEAGL